MSANEIQRQAVILFIDPYADWRHLVALCAYRVSSIS
jgi:hypothetical protein